MAQSHCWVVWGEPLPSWTACRSLVWYWLNYIVNVLSPNPHFLTSRTNEKLDLLHLLVRCQSFPSFWKLFRLFICVITTQSLPLKKCCDTLKCLWFWIRLNTCSSKCVEMCFSVSLKLQCVLVDPIWTYLLSYILCWGTFQSVRGYPVVPGAGEECWSFVWFSKCSELSVTAWSPLEWRDGISEVRISDLFSFGVALRS